MWSRVSAILNSAWTWFVGLCACLGFWADFPIEKSRLNDAVSSLFPLAGVVVPYMIFVATIYFGGQFLLWGYKTFMFFRAGGPLREEFATYGVQIDGLIQLLRIARMPDESEKLDVEVEARLLVELGWFSNQMKKFGIRTPAINPDAIKNVIPWTRYLVELEIFARHRQLKEARELEPEQNDAH